MTSTARKILDEALALPAEEREVLVEALVTSLQQAMPEDVERAWLEEVEQRLARLKRGETHAIAWSEARHRLRVKYGIG